MRRIKNIFFVFFCSTVDLYAQNLVPNHSFETIDSCDYYPGGGFAIERAIGWKTASISTPDMYSGCNTVLAKSVPKNYWGYQPAEDGNSYAGFYMFNPNFKNDREYIQAKLDSALKACYLYKVQFYVNVPNIIRYTVATIGAYFSNTAVFGNNYNLLPYTPQVNHDYKNKLTDTTNWMPINGTFMAKGGERYITIGNFNADSISNIDSIAGNTYPGAYYFVDNLSAIEFKAPTYLVEAGPQQKICKGASVSIGTAIDTTGIKANWQPAADLNNNTIPQPIATPTVTTTYTLTLSYKCGYTSTDTVTVQVNNPTATITTTKTNLCPGETGTATATVSNAVGPYTFSWSNGASTGSATAVGLGAGTYSVTVTDANTCTATTEVTFTNISAPTATISAAQTTITEGEQITLNGSGGVSYLWSPAATLSCTTCQNPIALPTSTTIYTLTVTAANGCTDTSDVTIKVNPLCLDERTIYVPNIFSPNNDGKNDVLNIEGNGLTNIYWGIYDRWGNLVFEAYDQTHPWDGTKKGSPVEAGVYSYYLRGTCVKTHGVVILKGNVSVVK